MIHDRNACFQRSGRDDGVRVDEAAVPRLRAVPLDIGSSDLIISISLHNLTETDHYRPLTLNFGDNTC
ncbi:MAG: hypothetical protein ACJA1R_000020 [Flavobacteriales bacterium]|jgi:hypothetical protein